MASPAAALELLGAGSSSGMGADDSYAYMQATVLQSTVHHGQHMAQPSDLPDIQLEHDETLGSPPFEFPADALEALTSEDIDQFDPFNIAATPLALGAGEVAGGGPLHNTLALLAQQGGNVQGDMQQPDDVPDIHPDLELWHKPQKAPSFRKNSHLPPLHGDFTGNNGACHGPLRSIHPTHARMHARTHTHTPPPPLPSPASHARLAGAQFRTQLLRAPTCLARLLTQLSCGVFFHWCTRYADSPAMV